MAERNRTERTVIMLTEAERAELDALADSRFYGRMSEAARWCFAIGQHVLADRSTAEETEDPAAALDAYCQAQRQQ